MEEVVDDLTEQKSLKTIKKNYDFEKNPFKSDDLTEQKSLKTI